MPSTAEIHEMISHLLSNAPPVEAEHNGDEPMITAGTYEDFNSVLGALLHILGSKVTFHKIILPKSLHMNSPML